MIILLLIFQMQVFSFQRTETPKSNISKHLNIQYPKHNIVNKDVFKLPVFQDDTIQNKDEEYREIIPVSYSFIKFKEAMEQVSIDGYSEANTLKMNGQYMAIFMKSVMQSVTIVATSTKNVSESDFKELQDSGYETFKQAGYKMMYGQGRDDNNTPTDMSVLTIEYPEYEMIITIMTKPRMEKSNILEIAGQLDF